MSNAIRMIRFAFSILGWFFLFLERGWETRILRKKRADFLSFQGGIVRRAQKGGESGAGV